MGSVLSQLQIPEIVLSALSGEAVVPEATNAPDLEEKLRNCSFLGSFLLPVEPKGVPSCPGQGTPLAASECRERGMEPRGFQPWRINPGGS